MWSSHGTVGVELGRAGRSNELVWGEWARLDRIRWAEHPAVGWSRLEWTETGQCGGSETPGPPTPPHPTPPHPTHPTPPTPPHLTPPHPTPPHPTPPCPALPRPALLCPTPPRPALPCPALPCPTLPRPALPHPTPPQLHPTLSLPRSFPLDLREDVDFLRAEAWDWRNENDDIVERGQSDAAVSTRTELIDTLTVKGRGGAGWGRAGWRKVVWVGVGGQVGQGGTERGTVVRGRTG